MKSTFKKSVIVLATVLGLSGTANAAPGGSETISGFSALSVVVLSVAGSVALHDGGEFVVKAVRPVTDGISIVLKDSGTGAVKILKLSGNGLGRFAGLVGQTLSFIASASGTIIISGEEVVAFIAHPRSRHLFHSARFGSK
ncbi:MAG: hypothetical protein P8N43_07820 [Alphaproteobacteria bacterium]|jgi:hypothetical protein|nr:hypothetical protein [Alphaproteobacteria bacterium]